MQTRSRRFGLGRVPNIGARYFRATPNSLAAARIETPLTRTLCRSGEQGPFVTSFCGVSEHVLLLNVRVEGGQFLIAKRVSFTLPESDPVFAKMVALRRKSVSDLVRAQIKRIEKRTDLSADDRRRLDSHFSDNNDGRRFTLDGMAQPSFHQISHRVLSDGDSNAPAIPNAELLHAKIVRLLMEQFGYLADKLAATSSPDGSLLDRGYALWTNQIANGAHDGRNMPYVIIGGANGRLRTGRFVEAGGVGHNQLMNALLKAADVTKAGGAPVDDFGDASLTKRVLTDILV